MARVPLVGLAVALSVLAITAPILVGRGFVLSHDSVAVPEQDLLPWMWGAGSAPPRSVPQDAVVAVLDDVVGGAMVQRLLIAGPLMLLGLGIARLLRAEPRLAQAAAATFALWSAYVYERMVMGHWAMLLGVAVLPWLLDALAEVRAGRPGATPLVLLLALLGSLVPSAGLLTLAATALMVCWPGEGSRRAGLSALAGVAAIQVVWVVPGLLHPGSPAEASAGAFWLRGEGPAPALLAALGTGGVWNADAVPATRSGWLAVLAPLLLLALGALGMRRLRAGRGRVLGPLAVLAAAGLAWATATSIPALAGIVTAVEGLPGGGLLRDAQKWLGPWLVLVSLAAGLGLASLTEGARRSRNGAPVAVLALLIPVLLLPDLMLGAAGRLRLTQFPQDWSDVRRALEVSRVPGDVVSMPWSAFRSYSWNSSRTVLDPAPRFLPSTVVTDSRLLVGGVELNVIPSDDPRSLQVATALRSTDPAGGLARLGIRYVLMQTDQVGTPGFPVGLPQGLESASHRVIQTPTLELRRLDRAVSLPAVIPHWPVRGAWLVWGLVLAGALTSLALRALRTASSEASDDRLTDQP